MEFWPEFVEWAWSRHHNELSWYIRPLIIVAFCAAAWFRRPVLTVLAGLFFPISAVIFPAPATPKPYVVDFLKSERLMLESLSPAELLGFVGLVIAFLWILAAALWRRSFWLGVLVANLGGVVKLTVSLLLWPETGKTAIIPTVATALVFNAIALLVWTKFLKVR